MPKKPKKQSDLTAPKPPNKKHLASAKKTLFGMLGKKRQAC